MRRFLVSCMGLMLCVAANMTSPASAAAAEKFTCDACEYGGDEFCAGTGQNDWQFCGAGATYCDGQGWNIDCVWAAEDFPCVDPCTFEQ